MQNRKDNTLIQIGIVLSYIMAVFYVFGIVTIPLTVLNIIAAKKLKDFQDGNESRDVAIGWSIYLLVLGTRIGGVLALIGVFQESNQNQDVYTTTYRPTHSVEERLTAVTKLYDQGLISKEEYEKRRTDILNDL